ASLSVLGADSGGEAGLTYTWAATGAPPAAVDFAANGTNAAKNTTVTFAQAGTYNLQVTITNAAGFSTTSSVSVQVNQITTSVAVTPVTHALAANTTLSLAATALDQFGAPMASQPTITWSIASGAGSVSQSGLFTASRTAGTTAVRATTPGNLFGTANFTVFYEAVAWYQADASSGTTLADSSPNNLNATLTGAAAFGAGVSGNALSLTGGYANLPTGIVSGLNDFTIAAWVNPTTLQNWTRIFDFGTGTTVNMFLTAEASDTGDLRFAITTGGNGAEQRLDGPALALNQWTHVAVTLSGNFATLYVNGVAVATNASMTLHPTNLGITTQNYLGKSQYADPAFNGSIDDFRIYSRTLSAQEILQLASPAVVVPATVAPLTSTTAALSVLGSDVTAGESALTYTWATTGMPPTAVTFSANGTNAAKNTTVTFAKAGIYAIQVTIINPVAGLSVASSVTVTVEQVATSFVILPSSITVAASATEPFVASTLDQFGNPMSAAPAVTWSIVSGAGGINPAGVYSAPASAGSATVRGTFSGGATSDATITVVTPVVWYQANASSGTTLADSSGNGKNGTLSGSAGFAAGVSGNALSLTGGNATLPTGIVSNLNDFTISAWVRPTSLQNWARIFDFGTGTTVNMFLTDDAGGTNALRFAITTSGNGAEQRLDGPALTANVWTHVTVTLSGNTGTLYVNGVAIATNTNMTLHPASLGSTTQNYLGKSQYSADPNLQSKIDDFRIYDSALSAQQVLQLADPAVILAASASSNPVTTTSAALSVLGGDVTAGESALTYTWSTVGTPPAPVNFLVNGTNAAKNTTATFTQAGTYNFQVAIDNPIVGAAFVATSSVSVVVDQTLTSVLISPGAVNLTDGQTQAFSATGLDQFGNAFSTQPSFTWSLTNGSVGSVNSSGLYTAPLSPVGSATVRATSGAVSGTAAVSVSYLKGDVNLDGHRDAADLVALMKALVDLNAYQSIHSLSQQDLLNIADIDSDGHVTNMDVQALINLLIGGSGSFSNREAPTNAPASSTILGNDGSSNNDSSSSALSIAVPVSVTIVASTPPASNSTPVPNSAATVDAVISIETTPPQPNSPTRILPADSNAAFSAVIVGESVSKIAPVHSMIEFMGPRDQESATFTPDTATAVWSKPSENCILPQIEVSNEPIWQASLQYSRIKIHTKTALLTHGNDVADVFLFRESADWYGFFAD
ncbi:MAG TPA: LamG-like jellyroll fold domain-containing protein, partial [Pirellulales bacterium]|nr:LamG-like jellyroll fold domain-containing protein [Pirellulales bacterium]